MNQKILNPELIDRDNPDWTQEDLQTAVRITDLPSSLQHKLRTDSVDDPVSGQFLKFPAHTKQKV